MVTHPRLIEHWQEGGRVISTMLCSFYTQDSVKYQDLEVIDYTWHSVSFRKFARGGQKWDNFKGGGGGGGQRLVTTRAIKGPPPLHVLYTVCTKLLEMTWFFCTSVPTRSSRGHCGVDSTSSGGRQGTERHGHTAAGQWSRHQLPLLSKSVIELAISFHIVERLYGKFVEMYTILQVEVFVLCPKFGAHFRCLLTGYDASHWFLDNRRSHRDISPAVKQLQSRQISGWGKTGVGVGWGECVYVKGSMF